MEWGPQSIGAGFFCFHALEDTKQKKLTPLDRSPPLHVNRVLIIKFKTNWGKGAKGSPREPTRLVNSTTFRIKLSIINKYNTDIAKTI